MTRTSVTVPLLLFALVGFTGCKTAEKEKEAEPVLPVQVAEVKRETIDRIITAEGVLRAFDQSAVMPKISAPVRAFYVNRGDHVRKGQLLAVLENRDLAASVADTKGSFEQASAMYRNTSSATVPDELVKAQQDAEAAKQSLDAAQKLLESRQQLVREGALARRLVDEAATTYATAKSAYETARKHLESLSAVGRQEEIKGAEGQMQSAKGKLDAAQVQLSYSEIRTPIAGVVADRSIFPGEIAAAGSPVITVMDISRVIARVNVPQNQAFYIKTGQPATISATDGALRVQGNVSVVSPAIDPSSTTVEIWVQAANPGERFRPGGTVRVTINAGTITDALTAPAAAVLPSQEGGTVVMVIGKDSVAKEHKAEAGVHDGDRVQLVSGAAAGDKVVVSGGVGLQDGAKVQIQKAGANE